jgi:molybdopterin/thiamine biosynthesis adenylyltransferase
MLSIIRHEDIFNPRKHDTGVTIIGAGAIGSRIFAALVELGLTKIKVFDFDKVEPHNLSNQLYDHGDIGHFKVSALINWATRKLGAQPPDSMYFLSTRVEPGDKPKGTVFLLVDSMEERRRLVEGCIRGNYDVPRVIDCRMAATHGNVFMFDHSTLDQYLDTLIDDDQAEVSGCGSPYSVGTTASIISNLAVWQFMLSKVDPAAVDPKINVFLHPLAIGVSQWEKSDVKEAA